MKNLLRLTLSVSLSSMLFIAMFAFIHGVGATSKTSPIKEFGGKIEQVGPPWYNEAWRYRQLVNISNNSVTLAYYQVLIRLDRNNFEFDKAMADGADVRFTHSDGTTELKYWIESWDSLNKIAYIWVRVPTLANGSTSIYLYYDSPGATPISSGAATFDFYDDNWCQFSSVGCTLANGVIDSLSFINPIDSEVYTDVITPGLIQADQWIIINGSPSVSNGIMTLQEGVGIKTSIPYKYKAVGFKANFGLGAGAEWGGFINGANGQRTIIRDFPAPLDPSNMYLSSYLNSYDNVLIPKVNGNDWHNAYHIYELGWSGSLSSGFIDHGVAKEFSAQIPNVDLPVTLYNNMGSLALMKVDWIYVRQYLYPEPTVSLGTTQGLNDLGISIIDNPDPIRPGVPLTYTLSITNNNITDALGVIVTDTLPGSVSFVSIEPSQGECYTVPTLTCNLHTITMNSTAIITITVTPMIAESIMNTAIVSSIGFDKDLSNNMNSALTYVDSTPPNVNWEKPVTNDGSYTAYGGMMTLEASAADTGGVSYVEFLWYDHFRGIWNYLDKDYTYPYQVQFDSDQLKTGSAYQFYVRAKDQAGNISDPYSPLRRILITRNVRYFLPSIYK